MRPPVHMGAGIRQALWHQDSRRHVGTCWRLRRHANPCQSVRVSPATMPDGVRPAAEAISASEDALMLDSEAAAIMSSLSSGAASNECLLITPMSAADSSAAPVVGTMTVTGCPHCMGNHNFAHTCNKRRSKATVVAVSRSLRPKRGESSGPASSTTSAASAAGGASEQTPRALDFEPAATAEPPPHYESAVPERQNDAHLVPAAADAEPPHGAETAAMELVEMPMQHREFSSKRGRKRGP